MKVFNSVSFGCVFSAAVILALCVSKTISTSSARPAESRPDNFIEFHSAPDRVVDGSAVRVHYQCSRPCRLAVEVVVSTLKKTDFVVFRRRWIGGAPGVSRIHRVLLRLPPSILYQQDFFNRRVLDAQKASVRALLEHLDESSEPRTHEGSSRLKVYKVLQIYPNERPTACASWSAHLMWQMSRNRTQCPHESDVIDMLTFPLASTGEYFGVIRRLQPFRDRSLERARRHAVTKPRVTLSVWIYLLKWCHRKLCGIIHHVDRKNVYESVVLQLTDAGDVITQVRVTTGEDAAFRAGLTLPLWKWIRLDCYIQDSKALLDASWDDIMLRITYEFNQNVRLDDTDGYFAMGGSRFLPGIHGYFGPAKYYRFGTEQVKNQLQPKSTELELDATHQECLEIKTFTKAFLHEVTQSHPMSQISKDTTPFIRSWGQTRNKICNQTWNFENQLRYSQLFHFLLSKQEEIRTGALGMEHLGSALFEHAVNTVFMINQDHNKITFNSTSLLRESSCFGNHKASLLLASIYLSGLGNSVDLQKGHVYSLIGAAADHRLALMHAGYKHSQGLDGFPKDLDLAYSYYANTGLQSSIDINSIHENKQHIIEHIYLDNPEDLNQHNHEKTDVFQYVKFLAESGDAEAQRQLAAMLYRGYNGATKDLERAARWFKTSAMQMKDPVAMFDYAMMLMTGEGVEKNGSRGFRLMQKAAEMGSDRAMNGVGWYYGRFLKDHRNAVKYFEQAALNGNEDGIFNLGLYHLNRKNPDNPVKNETAAFQQFLKASRYGHVSAVVEAAWYFSTGNLEGVSQDVERAVMMLKTVCEQNGHLGLIVREALQAYLQGSRQEAFVNYVLAAETGLGLAQINVAHLCEELNLSPDCRWRYHNYSVLNYEPNPVALLKMGDYYYPPSSTRADSLSLVGRAVSMYGRAAVAGSPQGMFNLVLLVQQGHTLPPDVHGFFNVSHHDEQHTVVEKILKRCVEAESEDAVTPCSLALLGVQMGKALSRMTQSSAQLVLMYASLLSIAVIIVVVPLQSCLSQRITSQHVRAGSQDGVTSSREQSGIMGGNLRAAGIPRVITLKNEQWLRQTGEWVVTVSGVCLCVFWTALLYHLL
ncbi:protein sel-1 homolog 3 [Labrus mixtus]|uniref:protein sel-1 homolog 3 n=1 Tax=Labrus mixtus TaxID=508554 RepID=UPI0029C04067|nr:protein sel-1 homolog 3 [Labrus mixtus]XP_060885728.1 protein sel-1 homolog 3 [Labrus mixtus]